MLTEVRTRIVAHQADIGRQLNELPDDAWFTGDEELRHLLMVRDSLTSALMASSESHLSAPALYA
jgi:hypothetical protein